jgi:hypothetical protein
LAEDNKIIQNGGIWKGTRDENGQISLKLLSNETMKTFGFDKNIISRLEETKG